MNTNTVTYYRIIFRNPTLNGGWDTTDERLYTRKEDALERMEELRKEHPRTTYKVVVS
jgi:hypothetical protein